MTEINVERVESTYIDELKSSRANPSVLKIGLISLRSMIPNTPIFVFEGNDDKIVYFTWISRLRPGLKYEPFPCSGKRQTLQLRRAVEADMNNLGENVFFFIDRDFDDLQGHPCGDATYMTEFYSIENYLVTENALREFLKNEFHCHSRPDIRDPIVIIFSGVYDRFLAVSKDVNFRLFVGKRLGLKLKTHVPDRIQDVALVGLSEVTPPTKNATEIVQFETEPSVEVLASMREEFEMLVPAERYRGKFAYWFFERWLSLLADDYSNDNTAHFGALTPPKAKVRRSEIVLTSFAAKSDAPNGLAEFLAKVQ
ncbi:DUF4435 domain-containing protein [Devosia sp. YIM 151766]|uniref:DUF4435 domain-containing protein n=1 Tax=Devosia sp. YIM 151766 TaxID=3017325 RepID=UPI00255C739D|nr:DUF4435 domain-containing protein [Devosia sp. YIM 151766]WIY52169.1 DUF4435 domain-containing protein [Devosia sp. YIM 151766]